MNRLLALAAVIHLTGITPAVAAPDAADATGAQPSTRQETGSTGQGIRQDASETKQGAKNTAREVRDKIRNGAERVKRNLAVAQCNDGRYSYTHYRTCNHHGGVRQQFR